MPATAPLPPSPSPPATAPRRKRGRPRSTHSPLDRVDLAVEVLAAMASLPPTPDAGELAAAVGRPAVALAPVLDALGRSGLVERWPDPDHPGRLRVMLSARALARLGLRLAPRGDRWNSDRLPTATARCSRRAHPS